MLFNSLNQALQKLAQNITSTMLAIDDLNKQMKKNTAALEAIAKRLQGTNTGLRKPGAVSIWVLAEVTGRDSMLKFVLVLPPAGAADVVNRDLSVQINGTEPEVFRLDGAAMSSQELSGTEGDVVTGSLVDIDDAGNASQPREFSFTLADTLAPPQPGELGLQVTSEI